MSLYKQPGSAVWWANISVPGHPRVRRSTGATDRLAAQRVHDEIKAGLWSAPKLTGKTWGNAVLLWCSTEERSQSELLSLRKFSRVFKDCPIGEVSRESVHKALSFCKTAGTYTRYRTMIAAILNLAKHEGWLNEVPRLTSRTDKKTKVRDWLTPEQWEALSAELPAHMQPMAEFSVETGLRQANVLGLEWKRVDLERALVWVEGEDMKAGNALAVPLNQRALAVLRGRVGIHPDFVFTYRGKPIKEIKTAFIAACVRAGVGRIDASGHYQGFTWHGLRHTWATWHIQNGTPVEVLQKLGGWSDMRMVMNYGHHAPGFVAGFADNTRRNP